MNALQAFRVPLVIPGSGRSRVEVLNRLAWRTSWEPYNVTLLGWARMTTVAWFGCCIIFEHNYQMIRALAFGP
jgi:hypothetical protein